MTKFNIHNWLFELATEEANDSEQENPTQNNSQNMDMAGQDQEMAPQSPAQPPEQTPAQKGEVADSQSRNAFRSVQGATISDISFKKLGSEGSKIQITTSKSHIPLQITWLNGKVTVTDPSGNIIILSE